MTGKLKEQFEKLKEQEYRLQREIQDKVKHHAASKIQSHYKTYKSRRTKQNPGRCTILGGGNKRRTRKK